jgi:serine/threonine protein kinase
MGVVYKARDTRLDRLVAIKSISALPGEQSELLRRFFKEARTVAQLQHPNIVSVYDLDEQDGVPYIVMEYLVGESVDKMIARRESVPIAQKIGYVIDVCRGLAYAHRQGLVHRDIKPSNVFVTHVGEVKILDFGIARQVDLPQETRTGELLGTLAYMSPEQLRLKQVDSRSDIWSVGVLLYELLTFEKPFGALTGSEYDYMSSIITSEPRPLQDFLPDAPGALQGVLQAMLRKEASERYQSMDEVLGHLIPIHEVIVEIDIQDLLSRGRRSLDEGHVLEARDVVQAAIRLVPSNQEAKDLLQIVTSNIQSQSFTARLQKSLEVARSLIKEGRLSEARNELNGVVGIDPAYQPARELLTELEGLEQRAASVATLLEDAKKQIKIEQFTSAEQVIERAIQLSPDNYDARKLLDQLRSRTRALGVTVLQNEEAPTGFFDRSAIPRTSFFEGDQARYTKIQDTLQFYRDHLDREYQSLSKQAHITYILWIVSVTLGLGVLLAGIVLLIAGRVTQGSMTAISATVVYFIQKIFQQREDHYRGLAAAKNKHLEYGNQWLLVIQSIDAIEDLNQKRKRQDQLVDVLTKKLAADRDEVSRVAKGPKRVRKGR